MIKIHILMGLSFILLAGCATIEGKAKISEELPRNCIPLVSLNATSFSLIPPVAKAVARSILIDKADEFGADIVLINKTTGLFNINIKATGYDCP